MSRDGSGIYHLPSGLYPQAPNTTIESGDWNSLVADLEQDANVVRPVVAGGTGSGTAAGARTNLQTERSQQAVTNYDAQVWENGSFYSLAGATSAPSINAFTGTAICYGSDPTNYIVLNAVDVINGKTYVRVKTAGVWGAWAADYRGGFTATGDITISKSNAQLTLNRITPASETARVLFQTNGVARMSIGLWPGAESGANAAGDLNVVRSTDGGAIIDIPFVIQRATGFVGIGPNISPAFQLDVVHNANDNSVMRLVNTNGGAAATSTVTASNGSNAAYFGVRGTATTVNGVLTPSAGQLGADQDIAIFALGGPIKFAAGGVTQQMSLSTAGNLAVTGPQHTFGTGVAVTSLIINGSNSGVGGGSMIMLGQAGAFNHFAGSYSSITGGAYDNRFLLYSNNNIVLAPVGGNVNVSAGTASNSPATGALTVVGGVGVGGRINGTTGAGLAFGPPNVGVARFDAMGNSALAANGTFDTGTNAVCMIMYRDMTSGGAAFVIYDGGSTTIMLQTSAGLFSTTDGGAGSSTWWVQPFPNSGKIVNRFAGTRSIYALILGG